MLEDYKVMREKLEFSFLGESYSLPKDILTYVSEHHCFEQMRQEFLKFMIDTFPDCENLPDNTEELIDRKFRYYADICVKKLLEKDIYDITVDDFLSNNSGVTMFTEVLKQSMLERTQALLEEINGFMEGAQEAEYIRDSQVTGTGFSIITGNPIGFGVWAAMESSALKKQATKADAEFSSRIDSLINQGHNNTKNRIKRFNVNVWLPTIKNSVDTFVLDLFNKYINFLIKYDLFDKEALAYNDIERAESILENINNANNKPKLINSAFIACPYCFLVYVKSIESQTDVDSVVSVSKIFELDKKLYDYYMEICVDTAMDMNRTENSIKNDISPYCIYLSALSSKTFYEEVEQCLSLRRKKISKSLNDLLNMSNSKLDYFLRTNVATSVEDIIHKCEETGVEQLVLNCIDNKILKGENSAYYDKLKEDVIKSIVSQIKLYIDEAKARYAEYQNQTEQFEAYRKEKLSQIEELRSKLSKLGWFSASKKKKIEEEISEIENDIKEKNCDVFVALSRFQRMYN